MFRLKFPASTFERCYIPGQHHLDCTERELSFWAHHIGRLDIERILSRSVYRNARLEPSLMWDAAVTANLSRSTSRYEWYDGASSLLCTLTISSPLQSILPTVKQSQISKYNLRQLHRYLSWLSEKLMEDSWKRRYAATLEIEPKDLGL